MAAAAKTKASDKQAVCKKLVSLLKKHYKQPPPRGDLPVLETILYAICLENASVEQAETAYERLSLRFHDLNEVRVSSITELAAVFEGMSEPELRAVRIRAVLHYVFEKYFAFDFEDLRRKTQDAAARQLARVNDLSPCILGYTFQAALGSHAVPIDDVMRSAAVWLGLVEPQMTTEEASESLKPAIRKADAPLFCRLLRCLATDPLVSDAFDLEKHRPPEEGYDLDSAPERLAELLKRGAARPRKKKATAGAAKRKTAKAGARNGRAKKKTTKKKTRTPSR